MDEQYLKDLYNWITTKDKSFGTDYSPEQFISDMGDSEYASEMYGWVAKNDPTFSQDYSLQDFLKDVGADKKKGGVLSNALSGITGFLEEGDKINQEAKKRSGSLTAKDAEKKLNPLQKERIKSITEFVEPPTDAEIFGSKKGIIKTTPEGEPIYTPPTVSRESTSIEKPIDIAAEKTKEQERIKAEEKRKIEQDYKNIRNWQSSNRLDEQESKKLLEDEQMRAKEAFERTSSDKDLMSGLGSITSDLIGQSEEKVVPLLNEKFSKYGFSFAQSSWADDEMVVTTEDGKNSITIDLNPSKSVDKQKEANKLKDFLSKFNIAPEKEKSFIDKEGEKFYAERGRDYYTEKRRWERYSELSEIVGFFEGYGGDKEELQKEHPELFFEGDARWDIKDKIKEYKKELETLTPLIKDNTFFNQKSNSIERTREDFDSYIAKEENKIAKKSADLNQEAKAEEDIIRLEARTKFNMDFEDLLYMKSDNPEYQKEIDGLIQRFITAQDARKQAFMNYEDAKLYYDEKINKEIEGDLTDDFQAVWNTVGDNFKEGMVNDQLLAIALPGMYIPYSGTTDIKEATEYIIKKRQQMSGTQSRVEVRLANAKTKEEYLDIMLDNPLESIAVASAGSIALMLPTAVKIIPAFILGGGFTGAVAGSPGGLAGMGTGFATGAKKGLEVGQAVNNFAVEYTAAVMESVKKRGYNAMDPESLQAALEDPRTWKDAEAQATARGIPIAIADYLSSNLVGRVFKPASKIASIPTRTALGIAERAVVDPLMESGGELFAQASEIVTGTGRTELDWKEIAAEGRGAMGSKVPNLAIKMYSDIKNNRNIDLARNLTTIHNVGIETASDTRISNWANNMQKLGKIDADVNQRIQENVGLKRDAREVLNIGQTNKKTEGPVVGRVMELLSAKKELSATKNRQEVYSEKIKEINNELATISQTKELLPTEKRVSLDGIIEAKRSDVSEYMINGRTYNKEGFINKINTMSPNRLGKASIGVKGDPETSNIIKEKYNAIQKQTTGKVSLQPEAGVGEAMVEGESQPGLEVTTEKIVLSPEENKRKENLTAALTQPENKEGTIVIDDTPMNRDEAQAELDNLIKKETAPVKTEEKISILETPDNTAKALTELSTEEKTNVTFTNQEGKNVPVNGNEKVLSDLYHEAIKIDEDQRTDAQQSAIDTVELSLMEKVKAERDAKQIEQIASRAKAKTEATKNAGISITNKASVDTVKTNVSNQLKTATTEQQKTRVKEKVKIIEKAQKAINTLKSILPNFDIVIHDNEGSYNARMEEVNGEKSSGGSFSYQKNADGTYSGKIDINLEKANLRTVAHEVAHAIMLKAFGDNPALFKNFRDRISKVLTESSNEALMKFANQYEGDVTYEEYLVELTAALENEEGNIAPTILMKIASIINSVVSKISNGAIKPFEDIKKTKDLIEFFNSISNSIREGDDVTSAIEKLNNQQAYSEGVAIEVSDPKEFTATPISKSRIADYKDTNKIEILNTAKIPTKTLTEKVREYEGRVIIITSDATGYGIDSEGNPILGGPGFANNKKNVDDGIGFASLNIGTVKSTYTMAEKSYGKSKTLVLIMVQPPHTTINNSYGSNYIIRGLMEIGKKNKDELAKAIDSIKGFVSKSKSVQKEFKNESKKAEGEAKTRSTQDALFKVLDKIKDAKNKEELVNEYLNVTTFNIRKAIGLGILSPNKNTKTNKSTTYSKVAFNNIGYTIYDFLKEYGDQTILNDNMILKNKGGYVVAGFELDVLDTDKRDALISETQSKGIVHPLFNAKLPGKNHFVLDGLYSVNDNFAQYAKADKEIDYSKISKEEINKLVRENLKEDKFYTIASREKPLSERTYTDLKAEGKGLLKFKILGESKLKDKKPDVATKVSKGEGFSPVKGADKKMAETKFKPITKSQKVKQDAEVIQKIQENNPEVFEDLKNKIIFGYGKEKRTTTERKSAQEQVRQRAIGENKNEYVKAISDITRRVLEKKAIGSGSLLNKPGSKEIEAFAKENGFFYPSFTEISKGKTPKKGMESIVYMDESGKNVIKINNGYYNTDWADFFNRIMAHNIYFPETSYDFLGFTKRDGRLAVILKQPLVTIARGAKANEVKEEVEKRGLTFKSIYNIIDEYNNVSLHDFHEENAVIDTDGSMVFIDPIIQTNDNQIFSNYITDKYNESVDDGTNPEFVDAVDKALNEPKVVTKSQKSKNIETALSKTNDTKKNKVIDIINKNLNKYGNLQDTGRVSERTTENVKEVQSRSESRQTKGLGKTNAKPNRIIRTVATREDYLRDNEDNEGKIQIGKDGFVKSLPILYTGHKVSFDNFDPKFRGTAVGNQIHAVYFSAIPKVAVQVAFDYAYRNGISMATGKPLIATNTPFVSKVKIKNEKNALIKEERSEDGQEYVSDITPEIIKRFGTIRGVDIKDYESFGDFRRALEMSIFNNEYLKLQEENDKKVKGIGREEYFKLLSKGEAINYYAIALKEAAEELKKRGQIGIIESYEVAIYDESNVEKVEETRLYETKDELITDQYNKALEDGNTELLDAINNELGVEKVITKQQISAYHGSPYKFDKFTTDKMGTGEGAQAFGWGLYFTDLKSIAEQYAEQLSLAKAFTYNGKSKNELQGKHPMIVGFLRQLENTKPKNKKEALNWLEENKRGKSERIINELTDLINSIKIGDVSKSLYEVTLHQGKTPDQYTFLEWDKKPNKEQLINLFSKLTREQYDEGFYYGLKPDATNADVYKGLSKALGGAEQASLFLLENGIDGIKYPAESISRGVTSDTARGFNYVVFDENAVEIVTRQQKVKNEFQQIIEESRANGIGEEAIRNYFRNIGISEADIDTLLETEKGAAKKVEVSERTLPGFDRMMEQVQNIIDKSKERRATKQKTFENVMNYLEGSKAYQNATDVQREQMVRDIRKMFGKREKTAPSVGKIFGDVKNVNKITLTEKQLIDKQIKDLNRGAKDAKSAWLNASAIVAKAVKELVLSGKITTTQATNVISRFAKVNMFDDSSIERFVDYMSKVFEDANYLEKISNAKKLLPTAKNNVRTKIGISEVLTPLLSKLFNLNPSIIPDSVFESYLEVVDMMGKRQAVLTLKEVNDLTDQVNEILDTVQDELSTLDELIDIFNNYEGKITDENGNIDFSKTLAAMVSDENKPITFEDAELLKKYKSKVIPRLQKPKMSAEQKAEEKNALIKSIREFDVKEDNLPTREERDLARSLIQLLRTKGLDGLTNSELTNLLKVLDNINNGFISHYALLMREKLNAVNNAVVLNETIKRASSLPITKLIAKIKSLFPLQPSTQKIMVRETPKYFIDQVFGFFKDKPIFKTVFQAVAQGYSRYKTDANIVQEKLDKAFNKVTKSHWNNPRKVKMSTFKMMTYALQMEYESNIDSQNFYTASEYINATIKNGLREDSNMSEYDVNLLKNILKVYGKVTGKDENGKDIIEIDTNKLYDSFNPAEKSAIKTIQEVNSSLKDKALFTSAVIRGDKVKVYDNYIHHSVLPSAKSNNVMATMSSAQAQNNLMNPSTRAKSLMERTKGVKPLNFDIFSVTQKSANQILLDFHLTEPVRTARKTLKLTDENKNDTLKETRVFEAIDDAFETALRNVLMKSYNDNSFANSVVNFLTRQAYRTILASASRWASELGSNLLFVMTTDPRSYILGATKYKKVVMSENAIKILQNTGSTQSERLYSDSLLSGRMIDNSSMGQAVGLDGSPTKNAIANAIQTIHNNTTKKYGNFVAATSDTMISTPDKMMMRPFWFGVFANNFKKITGQEVDFNKIAENDEAYMNQFKDAIDFSTSNADQMSVFSGTTTNPFMTRQKGTITPGMNPLVQFYNTFNSFMNNFIVYEYITARTGIYAAMGAGTISRGQGARLLAATILRTTSYTLLSKMLAETLLTTILGPNEIEEEEDEKTVFQQIGQATAGSMTSLMLGRDFGNMSRSLINYGVERVNENYLEFLREGEYDYYKDAITYSAIPPEKAKPDPLDLIVNVAGPLQPTLKLFRRGYINLRSPESETESVNTGRELERYYKLPIELLGNVGVIPLYKDVQKVVNEQVKRKVAEAKFYEERRGK
jgi:hypothetical protein